MILTIFNLKEHVTISVNSNIKPEGINEIYKNVVYIEDLEKRKKAYGICGECNEPGTGERWCQPCNAKRFKESFSSWTSGNKDVDKLIQYSQLNATHYRNCLEWISFEKFEDIKYITRGGFGKIYSAKWPEGNIYSWDIENQKWDRWAGKGVALKCLDHSSDISTDFLNEVTNIII